MLEIYIEKTDNGKYRLCDFGMSLMRLSYSFKVDTPNKENIFQKILSENMLQEENGNIFMVTEQESLYPDLMHYTQAVSKISSMRYFKREVIESIFFEMLDDFILTELKAYNPRAEVFPIPARDDLEVDYEFLPNGHPVYLFGVKDFTKARLTTISCLEYQKANLNFRSFIVHEDFEKLPKKDRTRLTSACDKQFTSLDDFKTNAIIFLDREKM